MKDKMFVLVKTTALAVACVCAGMLIVLGLGYFYGQDDGVGVIEDPAAIASPEEDGLSEMETFCENLRGFEENHVFEDEAMAKACADAAGQLRRMLFPKMYMTVEELNSVGDKPDERMTRFILLRGYPNALNEQVMPTSARLSAAEVIPLPRPENITPIPPLVAPLVEPDRPTPTTKQLAARRLLERVNRSLIVVAVAGNGDVDAATDKLRDAITNHPDDLADAGFPDDAAMVMYIMAKPIHRVPNDHLDAVRNRVALAQLAEDLLQIRNCPHLQEPADEVAQQVWIALRDGKLRESIGPDTEKLAADYLKVIGDKAK